MRNCLDHGSLRYFFPHTHQDVGGGVAILFHKSVQFSVCSKYADNEGRFILINGTLSGVMISLFNIYAPNETNTRFMNKMFSLINEKAQGRLLMGGDFNCVLSPLDRNPFSHKPLSIMSKALKNNCVELGMIDIWRHPYPRDRDFTFYSHPHNSYSRVDYFFVSGVEAHRVIDCKIHNITLSDHVPVSLVWDMEGDAPTKFWQLNTSLLGHPAFQTYIESEFKYYLDTNNTGDVSAVPLWEAAKAVLRGRVIAYASAF